MRLKLNALILSGASLLAGAAHAQNQSPAAATINPEAPAATGDIIVTGSRTIKNGNASPSPVTVVSTQDALRIQPAGTLADALNLLPVFAGSRGPASNPSSTGTAAGGNGSANQLNLRNLGSNRTLILLDGERVPPTTFNGIVDVDIIPQLLVQRVETVTGGVSAVYGSDAVAGVVNYILDKKFVGLSATFNSGISQRGDALKLDAGLAGGANLFGGRGHVEFAYEYLDNKGIPFRSDRPALKLYGVTGAGTAANPYQLNSDVRQAGAPFGGLITSGVLINQTFGTDGVLRPFVAGQTTGTAALQLGGDGGYYDSSLIAALKAHQLFGRFDYELTDTIRFHAQVSGDLKTNVQFRRHRPAGQCHAELDQRLPRTCLSRAAGGRRADDVPVQRAGQRSAASAIDREIGPMDLCGRLRRIARQVRLGREWIARACRSTHHAGNQCQQSAAGRGARRSSQSRQWPDRLPSDAVGADGRLRPAQRVRADGGQLSRGGLCHPADALSRHHRDERSVGAYRRIAVQHVGRAGQRSRCRATIAS